MYFINFFKILNVSEIYLKLFIFSLRVLFTLDKDFVKTFTKADINKFIQLVKKNLDHSSLKKLIGTTIKLSATIRKVSTSFKDTGGSCRGRNGLINKGDW